MSFLLGLWIGANVGLLIALVVLSWGESDRRSDEAVERAVEDWEARRRRRGLHVERGGAA